MRPVARRLDWGYQLSNLFYQQRHFEYRYVSVYKDSINEGSCYSLKV